MAKLNILSSRMQAERQAELEQTRKALAQQGVPSTPHRIDGAVGYFWAVKSFSNMKCEVCGAATKGMMLLPDDKGKATGYVVCPKCRQSALDSVKSAK
jgi:hypothetical protein